jgi:hypothetical protein
VKKWWIATMAGVAALAILTSVAAQDRKSQLRTVHGIVISKEEVPLPGGIVYLKNLKSLTVRTYIADGEGRYRYSGLDPNVDYEIHAEHQGMASAKRTISTLNSSREIVINLKVDKKKD